VCPIVFVMDGKVCFHYDCGIKCFQTDTLPLITSKSMEKYEISWYKHNFKSMSFPQHKGRMYRNGFRRDTSKRQQKIWFIKWQLHVQENSNSTYFLHVIHKYNNDTHKERQRRQKYLMRHTLQRQTITTTFISF